MTSTSDDDRLLALLPTWQAETVRATLFPAADAQLTGDTWWRDVLGTEPETRTTKPGRLERREEGPLGENRLVLTVNPLGVIQWQITPPPTTEMPEEMPVVGNVTALLDPFLDLVDRWFPRGPRLTRLALGVTGILPVGSHEEAYRTLGLYLRHYVRVDPASSDFIYRINRRRPSRTDRAGLKINRLCSWSALRMALLGPIPTALVTRRERFACRVELDINTAAEFQGLFEPEECGQTFRELRELGVEILAKGDTP